MGGSSELSSMETWAFRPALENSWMSEAFARDTEALTKALQQSISEGTPTAAAFSDVLNAVQQTQSVSSSESETVSKRLSRNTFPAIASRKITKRKSRASKRSPTTYITADPSNFREMVQQVTGVGFSAAQDPMGSLLKPEPQSQRQVGAMSRLQAGCLLPTLDTSAFLLEHHQQVAAPPSAAVVGQNPLGFGPPAGVAEGTRPGFDFDGLSCFPTLDSWKVM